MEQTINSLRMIGGWVEAEGLAQNEQKERRRRSSDPPRPRRRLGKEKR